MGHVGKTRAETLVIGTDERVLSLQVDVVGDDDESALLVFQVDAAGCVGKNDGANIHAGKNPHGKDDLAGRVAFIQMDSALHGGHRNTVRSADHHLPGVSNGG